MKTFPQRVLVVVLFAALVVLLLWFQGILWRHEPEQAEVLAAPRVSGSQATAVVEERTLQSVQVFPGFVEAIDPADLAPRVMAGVAEVTVREDDAVEEGQLLVRLDDRDAVARHAQAQAAHEAAAAQALAARLAFERADRLLAGEAVTTQEWETARAARDGAAAGEERAARAVEEARTALSWFELTAPFAGRVLSRDADPGQLAAPGQALVSIYRPDRLRFAVAVPEERAAGLQPGVELAVAFATGEPRPATISRVLPGADPRSGTVMLHLDLASPTALRPGQLGRVSLVTGKRPALVVPARAVERIGQVERVRLVRNGASVPVTVRTGKAHGDVVEVLAGLAAGERVLLP